MEVIDEHASTRKTIESNTFFGVHLIRCIYEPS